MTIATINPLKPPDSILVSGDEPYFYAKSLEYLRERLSRTHQITDVWCTDKTRGGEVLLELEHRPFFMTGFSRVAIFVWYVEKVKDRNKHLKAYLDDPCDTTTAVFVVSQGSRAGGAFLTAAATSGVHFEAKKLVANRKVNQYADWISEYLMDRGLNLPHELCLAIHEHVGSDLFGLESECRKLLTFANGRQISSDEFWKVMTHRRNLTAFDLCDMILQRRATSAMKTLQSIYESTSLEVGDPTLLILGALQRNVLIWFKVLTMASRNVPFEEIAEMVSLPQFVVEKIMFRQLRKMKPMVLVQALARLCEADYKVKSGSQGRLLVEAIVLELVGRKKGTTRLEVVYDYEGG